MVLKPITKPARPVKRASYVCWGLLFAAAIFCRAQNPAIKEELDLVYGEAGGQRLLLDVIRQPDAKQPQPIVMLVHGGGWAMGDKKDFRQLAQGLARAGFVAVSPNYRLATTNSNRYPAQLDDVQRSVRWIQANAAKFNANSKKVGALGASAGGHLAGLLGTVDTHDNRDQTLAKYSSRVVCVVDLAGPSDLTSDFRTNAVGDVSVQSLVDNLLGKTMKAAPELFRDASPIFHIDRKTAPFLIIHGTADTLIPIDQSQRLHEALQKAGIESKLLPFEGEGHIFAKKENGEILVREVMGFFEHHLK